MKHLGLAKQFEYLATPIHGSFSQNASALWQNNWGNLIEDGYNLTERTCWKNLNNPNQSVSFSGRMIGGCLDTISALVGTPFGDLNQFKETCKTDGCIFYFENCELKPADMVRRLLQMKLAGWFDNLNGILIGRSSALNPTEPFMTNYKEALHQVFSEMNIPVIWDVDIGHLPPQLNLINGSIGKVDFKESTGSISQTLK